MSEPAEQLLEEVRAMRADLEADRARREEREAALAREIERLRAVTSELLRRRARRAEPAQTTDAPAEVRAKVYEAMAKARRRGE